MTNQCSQVFIRFIQHIVLPYFDSMPEVNQKFHARNVFQVCGKEKQLSEFIVYYAPVDTQGNVLGGTRTAVNLGKKLGIKTYNLKIIKEAEKFLGFLDNLYDNKITDNVSKLYLDLSKESY